MSKKTELEADLKRVGYQLGGAHLTRQARSATFSTFASAMRQLGYGIQSARQIGGKHLQAFAAARAAQGISARSRANELSHLRAVLSHIGKQGLVRNPAYSNQALGIERGSRIGTKQPLSDTAILSFQDRMERLGRPGIGATLELQRALGLREAEAIRAGQAETLARWQRELEGRGSVRVVEGTKGGRPREVHPANHDRALAAIACRRRRCGRAETSVGPGAATLTSPSAISVGISSSAAAFYRWLAPNGTLRPLVTTRLSGTGIWVLPLARSPILSCCSATYRKIWNAPSRSVVTASGRNA